MPRQIASGTSFRRRYLQWDAVDGRRNFPERFRLEAPPAAGARPFRTNRVRAPDIGATLLLSPSPDGDGFVPPSRRKANSPKMDDRARPQALPRCAEAHRGASTVSPPLPSLDTTRLLESPLVRCSSWCEEDRANAPTLSRLVANPGPTRATLRAIGHRSRITHQPPEAATRLLHHVSPNLLGRQGKDASLDSTRTPGILRRNLARDSLCQLREEKAVPGVNPAGNSRTPLERSACGCHGRDYLAASHVSRTEVRPQARDPTTPSQSSHRPS